MTNPRYLLFVICAGALAQDPVAQPTPSPAGSISGVVTAAGTGAPIADVEVAVDRGASKSPESVTDAQGRYTIRGVEPGARRVTASAPAANGRVGFGPSANKQVTLLPGQDLTSFDFQLQLPSRITGKITDQNKEPVSGASVLLVSREYVGGALRNVFVSSAQTDDQGNYWLERAQAGRSYLVMAKRRPKSRPLDPISDAPAEPSLRRPSVIPTFYPNSPTVDGAQPVSVRDGETREGIDIRMMRGLSLCVEGTVEGLAGDIYFDIGETTPTAGISGNGGLFMGLPGGTVGPDGKIRVCDLHPGDYEITAQQRPKGMIVETQSFGSTVVTLTDRDLKNVRVVAQPRMPLSGEVVWDVAGPAGEKPLPQKLNLFLESFQRTERGNVQAEVPGEFTFAGGMLMDTYALRNLRKPPGIYVKEIRYGDANLLLEPLRMGSAIGNAGIRVVVSRNGGTVTATVTDKDNNPEGACNVVLMPGTAASEGAFAASLIFGRTDQRGRFTSEMIAPGKYYAFATNDPVNRSLETIRKILQMKPRSQDVDLTPGGTVSLNLTPRPLD